MGLDQIVFWEMLVFHTSDPELSFYSPERSTSFPTSTSTSALGLAVARTKLELSPGGCPVWPVSLWSSRRL